MSKVTFHLRIVLLFSIHITTRISFLGNLHGGSVVASYPFDSGTEKPRGWDAKGIYSEGKISNEHLLLPKRGEGYHNWTIFVCYYEGS